MCNERSATAPRFSERYSRLAEHIARQLNETTPTVKRAIFNSLIAGHTVFENATVRITVNEMRGASTLLTRERIND